MTPSAYTPVCPICHPPAPKVEPVAMVKRLKQSRCDDGDPDVADDAADLIERLAADLAAMTAKRDNALEQESNVVEYAAKIQAELNDALAQAEASAKDAARLTADLAAMTLDRDQWKETATMIDYAGMVAQRDAALKQRDYNREVIARRNVALARAEADLAAIAKGGV